MERNRPRPKVVTALSWKPNLPATARRRTTTTSADAYNKICMDQKCHGILAWDQGGWHSVTDTVISRLSTPRHHLPMDGPISPRNAVVPGIRNKTRSKLACTPRRPLQEIARQQHSQRESLAKSLQASHKFHVDRPVPWTLAVNMDLRRGTSAHIPTMRRTSQPTKNALTHHQM